MTLPHDDRRFEDALKIFDTQVAEATQFWFAAGTMNQIAVDNPDTLTAINLTPQFWITVRVGLEYQGILSVGKLFGPRKTNPHNIDTLFETLREIHATVFSKSSLATRKRRLSANADDWLPQFMQNVHVPEREEIDRLQKLSRPHRKTYETQYKRIRDEHIAHTGLLDPNAKWEVFQKTKIADLEQLLGFLNQLHDVLWGMYYNGEPPALRPSPHSVRELVAEKLEDLREGSNQGYIVAETRRCMALLTRAANSLSLSERLSRSWV